MEGVTPSGPAGPFLWESFAAPSFDPALGAAIVLADLQDFADSPTKVIGQCLLLPACHGCPMARMSDEIGDLQARDVVGLGFRLHGNANHRPGPLTLSSLLHARTIVPNLEARWPNGDIQRSQEFLPVLDTSLPALSPVCQ